MSTSALEVLGCAQALTDSFKFVLASGSPRRRELLQILGMPFDVVTSGFPEDLDKSLYSPAEYVVANAMEKCKAVASSFTNGECGKRAIVIGADTVVSIDGSILEKPPDRKGAHQMLSSLSGRSHDVFTGVAVAVQGREGARSFVERTEVTFATLSAADIDAYIETGEPFDKAGGYGIQSKGSLLVRCIRGDYFNVVGLPIAGLARLLAAELSMGPDFSKTKKRKVEGNGLCTAFIDKLALVLVRDRKQLVARSRGKNAFFTPGGKREAGESDEQALTREIKEELDVDLVQSSIKPYGVFTAQAHGKPEGTLVRLTCYTAEHIGTLTATNEIEQLKWVVSADRSLLSVTGVMLLDDLLSKGLID